MNKKSMLIILTTLFILFSVTFITPVFASTTDMSDTIDIVLDFMPVIITFAMLGMILGLLKKFGKV